MTGTRNESLIVLQLRVIATLVLRETRASFGTSSIGYLWAIITPAVSVGLLFFIFTMIDRQPPYGQSLALFFATGILTIEFFNKLSHTLMAAFDANRALLTYPLIKGTDALFARLVLVSATYLVIMVLFYGGLCVFGLASVPAHPEKLLCAFCAIAALGFGFGTLNAVISSLWASWAQIEKILTRPLVFISGVFYVPSQLPPEATEILWWNPVVHLVEWVREGFYPHYDSALLTPEYPLFLAMCLILLGLGGERLFRKKRN
jgi:capsular polysaccharide transport system permease protein